MKISLIGNQIFGKEIKNYAWLCLIIVVICLGIFFRCANLGSKIFWVDEVATYVRISGYQHTEVIQKLTGKKILTIADLKQYQQVSTSKNWQDTFSVLKKSPEHTPLYFLLARLWVQIFGNSVATLRSLSVVCSLLALPCLYWLNLELFKSSQIAQLSVMLLSVSPFYVAYAQEARPYSLWTLTILFCSAILLKALRTDRLQDWAIYTISLTLAFYTSLFSCLVIIGHGIYVLTSNKFKLNQKFKNYLFSLSLAILTFLPWCLVMYQNWQILQENTSWMDEPLAFSTMLGIWIASILLIFGDLPLSPNLNPIKIVIILVILTTILGLVSLIYFYSKKKYKWILSTTFFSLSVLITIILNQLNSSSIALFFEPVTFVAISTALMLIILATYSLLFLSFNYQQKISCFILNQAIATPVILIITDLVFNDQRSATPRYLIPAQLAIHLAVVCLLANQFGWLPWNQKNQIKLGRIIVAFLLSLSIISCFLNLNKSPQYQKSRNLHNLPIANLINQASNPLVISETNQTMDVISLSYSLQNKVKLKLLDSNRTLSLLPNYNQQIFLFNPSSQLKQKIRDADIEMQEVYRPKLIVSGEIYLSLWLVKL